jgi:hypothetical protein
MRFTCSTGDAMGMNMVSKGVQNVLHYLQDDFPDMDVISISGFSHVLNSCYYFLLLKIQLACCSCGSGQVLTWVTLYSLRS